MTNPFAGLTARVRRAVEAFYGTDISTGDPDYEPGYRRLTGRSRVKRDLDPLAQEQARRVSRFLYDANPLAQWLIDMVVDLTLGDEVGYSVEVNAKRLTLKDEAKKDLEDEIKRVLDRFWEHPNFNIRFRADELATALRLDGDLCLHVAAVNEVDGVPALDFIDASQIAGVDPLPGSSLTPGTVRLVTAPGEATKTLRVVTLNPKTQRLEGECFYFGNGKIPNAMRGRPELLPVADWIDSLDQMLFARVDRATFMNFFTFDVTLKNADAKAVLKREAEIRRKPPTPGTVNVHNDSEAWDAVTPDLKSEDATGEIKNLLNYILGSKSIPSSWYADGGDATRTTASEQNIIALMALKRFRKRMLLILRTLLEFAYDTLHAKQPALFPARLEGGIKLVPDLRPIDEKDLARLGGVIQNIEAALESAVANERLSARTARKVMLHVVDALGVPVDPDDEKAQIDAEEEEREVKRQQAADALAAQALAAVPKPNEKEPTRPKTPPADDDEAAA